VQRGASLDTCYVLACLYYVVLAPTGGRPGDCRPRRLEELPTPRKLDFRRPSVRPGCQQCRLTFLSFEKAGLDFTSVDLTTNDAAPEYIPEVGYAHAPIVMVDEDPHWSGFNPTEIERLTRALQHFAGTQPEAGNLQTLQNLSKPDKPSTRRRWSFSGAQDQRTTSQAPSGDWCHALRTDRRSPPRTPIEGRHLAPRSQATQRLTPLASKVISVKGRLTSGHVEAGPGSYEHS
jgi:glutaredoxin-like protein NrdH